MPPVTSYVHGYSARESTRLTDQATALTDLLHAGTSYPAGCVLEAGCGTDNARRAIQCLVDLQRQAGGDSLIGRRLYPLLVDIGFRDVRVTPRMVYVDGSKPDLADGMTLKTFTAMVEGVAEQVIGQGLMDAANWAAGIADLRRAAAADGTFCYTFFRATALRLSVFQATALRLPVHSPRRITGRSGLRRATT